MRFLSLAVLCTGPLAVAAYGSEAYGDPQAPWLVARSPREANLAMEQKEQQGLSNLESKAEEKAGQLKSGESKAGKQANSGEACAMNCNKKRIDRDQAIGRFFRQWWKWGKMPGPIVSSQRRYLRTQNRIQGQSDSYKASKTMLKECEATCRK